MAIEQLADINQFLHCVTPELWVQQAVQNLPTLIVDHANCEKKAASTALSLMYRYTDKPTLLQQLSRLAREELRHFEQVLDIMHKRDIEYVHVSPSRYAQGLRELVQNHEPAKLIDLLIVGAIVEARSCERFGLLQLALKGIDDDLSGFYELLLASEARHFRLYLDFASVFAETTIDDRIAIFLEAEAVLIARPDTMLRFHSGPLAV